MPKKINNFNKRKRNERNRLIFIISAVAVVCIALIIAIILWNPSDQAENNSSLDSSSLTSGNSSVPSGVSSEQMAESSQAPVSSEESKPETPQVSTEGSPASSIPVTKVDGDWKLVLANPTHRLPDDFSITEAPIQGYTMDSRAVGPAKEMIAAAKADGVDLLVCSAYRPISTQKRLYNNKVQEYLNQGNSQAEAERIAATIVAIPGTSEHQTGLALDIVTPSYQTLDDGYENTAAAQWLKANAADYGFILRFPKDKEDITKIIFEPWHYRYVGVEAAQEIMSKGICLEEYLGEVD
mgnify:CR=1 FL=1